MRQVLAGGVGIILAFALAFACQPPGDQPDDGDPCSQLGIADEDRDGISDYNEGAGLIDTDGDGKPDTLDPDSDNDGRLDRDEIGAEACTGVPVDSDRDDAADFRDLDSDDNGLPDSIDTDDDRDGDEAPDWRDLDDDGDGIIDRTEIGPDPADPADADGDGTDDFHDGDSDGDGILDRFEGTDDPDGDGLGSFRDPDSDEDGLLDRDELGGVPGSEPVDTDADGVDDYLDLDSDDDQVRDWEELAHGTSPVLPDTDMDMSTDYWELLCGTDPTDGSSYPDGGVCQPSGCTATELCGGEGTGDGLDNDCDGHVDETCECEAGTTQGCFSGPPAARGKGNCVDGSQTCTEFSTWTECEGSRLPEPEVCGDSIDQNCDGEDEECCEPLPDCLCTPGAARYCDTPTYCSWGIQYCNDDGMGWGYCDESGPAEGCTSTYYDQNCCMENDHCCQDWLDLDRDGDSMESVGNCTDVVCERCECTEGEERYCGSWELSSWGMQVCERTDDGWVWGPCERATEPAVCGEFGGPYDAAGEECCIESGFCCQDFVDRDRDGNTSESFGSCSDPVCCAND